MSDPTSLNALFEAWQKHSHGHANGFVCDGPVDEALWDTAHPRVLFVLKEANGRNPDVLSTCQYDLRRLFREKTWATIGRWAYGIQHASKSVFPSFSEADKTTNRDTAFRRCSVMNLKKQAGTSVSDMAVIAAHARRDRELILRQLHLLRADVVVCGGTFQILREILPLTLTVVGPDLRCARLGSSLYVDFHHPSARFGTHMPYYALMAYYWNAIRA